MDGKIIKEGNYRRKKKEQDRRKMDWKGRKIIEERSKGKRR